MYKTVQDYIDQLNEIAEETNDGFLDECDKKTCVKVRDRALKLLSDIFVKNDWSEEFVTSFAVYCNFFVLNGLHIVLDNDFGMDRFYAMNEMDVEDRQYLEYIRCGIFEQNVECFEDAINMGLYNFDIPKLYAYLLCFLELCLRDEEDFETNEGKEDIIKWFYEMKYYKEGISGELKELVEPQDLSIEEEKMISGNFSILLPKIIISSVLRRLSLAAISDLETMSNLCGNKIDSFEDMLIGLKKLKKEEDLIKYLIFADEFVRRTLTAKDFGDVPEYYGKDIEDRDGALFTRREFLNLPVWVSEKQIRNLTLATAVAEQMKLNMEKEILIKKNEKMVEDYSHSVENIIKPALIAEVANYLREDEKNRGLYNKIMCIYFNEVITQNECRLLKMVHNVSVSKGAIRESIARSKKRNIENVISLKEIVYKAINQISLQLAENSQKARFMFILEKMSQAGIDSDMIDNKLWDSSREIDAVYRMFSDKLNFRFDISEELEDVVLNEEEVGTSFLYTRIVEVISNALTYGDYGINKQFHLKIYTDNTDMGDSYIVIEMINAIGDRSFSDNREGNGLNATEAMLERINFINQERERFVSVSETGDGCFITQIYIDSDLYI